MNAWDAASLVLPIVAVPVTIGFIIICWRQMSGPVKPVDSLPKPPELSCFVRGLIRSMKETPTAWTDTGVTGQWWTCNAQERDITYRIMISTLTGEFNVWGLCPDTTRHERTALKNALQEYIIQPIQQRHLDKANAVIRSFEQLGCPNSPAQ